MSEKTKFALYLSPKLRDELERRYTEDGSCSQTAFTENALRFYLDYLGSQNAGSFLPVAIKSYLDGRLGVFENRMSALLFKQAVETDMAMSIVSDAVSLDEEHLRRQRGKSIANVRATNGQLRFEQIAREGWED